MGIENQYHHFTPENPPSFPTLRALKKWCIRRHLHPNTVKPIGSLLDVFQVTALGGEKYPVNEGWLTPEEKNLIKQSPKPPCLVIADIDGVLVSPWPSLTKFLEMWKNQPKFNPQEALELLTEAINATRPSPFCLKPLLEMSRRLNARVVLTTRRIPFPSNAPPFLKKLFQDFRNETPTLLPRFPFIAQKTINKLQKAGFEVVFGHAKTPSNIQKIVGGEIKNSPVPPYVIVIGSGILDSLIFKRIIKAGFPSISSVFCGTNHLLI